MTRFILVALITSCFVGTAMAQSCESKAVSAEGKPLHGAAKTSFIRKCKQDACESKAVSVDNKPLHGAAKIALWRACTRCPLLPQKRTWIERVGMSALCQKRRFQSSLRFRRGTAKRSRVQDH